MQFVNILRSELTKIVVRIRLKRLARKRDQELKTVKIDPSKFRKEPGEATISTTWERLHREKPNGPYTLEDFLWREGIDPIPEGVRLGKVFKPGHLYDDNGNVIESTQ